MDAGLQQELEDIRRIRRRVLSLLEKLDDKEIMAAESTYTLEFLVRAEVELRAVREPT